MPASFTQKMASVKGKVSQEVSPFHLSGTFARGQFFICFHD